MYDYKIFKNLTRKDIEKYLQKNKETNSEFWRIVSQNPNISEAFIEKCADKVN